MIAFIALSTFGITGCSAVRGTATENYAPGSIDAALVSMRDAGAEVGSPLWFRVDDTKPVAVQPVTPPECQTIAGPASDSVYGNAWTQFRLATFQETSNTWDHSLTQAVGRYENSDRAREAFTKLSDALTACGDKEVAVLGSGEVADSRWRNHADARTADTLRWNAEQLDAPTWRCFREARLKQSVLLQVALCQAGNGQPAAAVIADKLASKL
ncbi:sensor domain-containing protein [Nocardia sp. NPDC052112]|uniref:sensor domain-containing protein n=1 Tax=Nocardia sp. NPDC052112 TaxID=3155646 RepID=UPI0034315937